MLRKILPVLLVLAGLGAGVGAGVMLRPTAPEGEEAALREAPPPPVDPQQINEFVRFPNQFVVPILRDGRVESLVVMSVSVEVARGNTEEILRREPRLRDAFLQVLFDHANAGGFRGTFTDAAALNGLRRSLREAAQRIGGAIVLDVLIGDIMRQDS